MADDHGAILDAAADKHGVPRTRLRAMARTESGGDAKSVSPKGARGVLQVMPATAKSLGYTPEDMHDPAKNADAGARYLRQMYDRFKDWDTATEAYNAGPARVAYRKKTGKALPAETRAYRRKVTAAEAGEALAARGK